MQTCRLCHAITHQFLDLGRVPLPEEFRSNSQRGNPITTYPLGLSYCRRCFHIQLSNPVAADPIYKKNYFYDYSVTTTGLSHWQRLARFLGKRLANNDLVVDIGSNTGTLLSFIKKEGMRILGVDPATKLARIARAGGIPTIIDYFTPTVAQHIVDTFGQASVITATNVFDHVTDLSEITEAFRFLLAPTGTLIIEVPYFFRMITRRTHIPYHQQIDYMMLTQFVSFFQTHGMALIDAQEIPLHGGSMRIFIKHKGKPTNRLMVLLVRENRLFRRYPQTLIQFAKKVLYHRDNFTALIHTLKNNGKTIAAVGASAKGITFLNYCNLTNKDIDFITEKSPLKIGRFTPSGIPVVSDSVLIARQPDYAILLAWNFHKEIKKNLKRYKGKWMLPLL